MRKRSKKKMAVSGLIALFMSILSYYFIFPSISQKQIRDVPEGFLATLNSEGVFIVIVFFIITFMLFFVIVYVIWSLLEKKRYSYR